MDNAHLDRGSPFDLDCIDAMRYVIEAMCGIPQRVVIDGHAIEVRVEVKSS
jgi:hypothetical protein